MKDPLFIDALFLKTPERLEALGYVVLMAALFYSLLERRLRDSAVPIPSPSRRILTRPTAHELFRHLLALQVTPQPDGSRTVPLPEPFHATFWASLKAFAAARTVFYGAATRGIFELAGHPKIPMAEMLRCEIRVLIGFLGLLQYLSDSLN